MATYEDVRDQIEDGDLIFVGMNKRSMMHKIVHFITKSEYVHVAIAFWMSSSNGARRLFVVEAHEGGRRIVSLSSYKKRKILVVKGPIDWSSIEATALDNTGVVQYGYRDYIAVGLKELFGIQVRDHKGEICSEAVAKILKTSGISGITDTVISPGKLLLKMIELGCKQKFIAEPQK